MTVGRIDVHSHLLPGLDDGCKTVEESILCARMLVHAGYTHSFCTPHIWPDLPSNTVHNIKEQTKNLQAALDAAGVALRLFPGAELNLRADTPTRAVEDVPTMAMGRKFILIDLWANRLPPFFKTSIQWLQSLGLKVILAHPERMAVIQSNPNLADEIAQMGVLLQGNLQCFSDPPDAPTRRVAEQFLAEGRYFLLGTDLQQLASLPPRLAGLQRAIELAGTDVVDRMTIHHPRQLLEDLG